MAPEERSDLWLNDGDARWYDVRWNGREGDLEDSYGAPALEELVRRR